MTHEKGSVVDPAPVGCGALGPILSENGRPLMLQSQQVPEKVYLRRTERPLPSMTNTTGGPDEAAAAVGAMAGPLVASHGVHVGAVEYGRGRDGARAGRWGVKAMVTALFIRACQAVSRLAVRFQAPD